MKISIIIPAYNEEATLYQLVNKVINVKWDERITAQEIILVNDGSKDKTQEIMEQLQNEHSNINTYSNTKNSGKSQTVKNGILKSTGDLVVVQDADFEYEPQEINDLVKKMLDNDLDVVYGNRFGKKNKVIYIQNYLGNLILSFISNIFTYPRIKVYIPDMEVCYKLVRGDIMRDIAKTIESKSNFGVEPEITAKLSKYKKDRNNLKFGVAPISYYPRTIAEGKKMKALKDGIKALFEIIKFNLL